MISAESIYRSFADGMDAAAHVRVRRPGKLFQVDLPAFMADGDAAEVYVRPGSGGALTVTDLGATRTRLSYKHELTAEIDEELFRMALRHGLSFEDGEIQVTVTQGDLLPATLGLLQVEAQAERLATTSKRRAREADDFREQAMALLRRIFQDQLREAFHDDVADPESLYRLDALVPGAKPLAIALIPGDIDAERAVGAKLAMQGMAATTKARWLAIPRDIERLSSRTRKRLIREYITVASTFKEEQPAVEGRLRDLAEVA